MFQGIPGLLAIGKVLLCFGIPDPGLLAKFWRVSILAYLYENRRESVISRGGRIEILRTATTRRPLSQNPLKGLSKLRIKNRVDNRVESAIGIPEPRQHFEYRGRDAVLAQPRDDVDDEERRPTEEEHAHDDADRDRRFMLLIQRRRRRVQSRHQLALLTPRSSTFRGRFGRESGGHAPFTPIATPTSRGAVGVQLVILLLLLLLLRDFSESEQRATLLLDAFHMIPL